MELTYEQWKEARKDIKRRMSVSGWALLIYYGIMNVVVMGWVLVETLFGLVQGGFFRNFASIESIITKAAESAWGYFLAVAVGFTILLLWKKPRYLRYEVFAKGAPMKFGDFLTILSIFLGAQMVFQLGSITLELILNSFGYTIVEGMESLQTDPANFSMFLYAGILAPIAEEILFRGLIQRSMLPFGKKFAIFVSSFTFGLFHGNLIQSPYAFVVGLVLGYVAAEHNILWSMVLHMINNLLLGDVIYRLLAFLPEETMNLIVWGIIAAFAVAALILMIAKRKKISAWLRQEKMVRAYLGCYFSCAGTIVLMIILGLGTIFTTILMITPL